MWSCYMRVVISCGNFMSSPLHHTIHCIHAISCVVVVDPYVWCDECMWCDDVVFTSLSFKLCWFSNQIPKGPFFFILFSSSFTCSFPVLKMQIIQCLFLWMWRCDQGILELCLNGVLFTKQIKLILFCKYFIAPKIILVFYLIGS